MGQSFTLNPIEPGTVRTGRRKVLVTGAAGQIGSYFAAHSHQKYDLRLLVRQQDRPEAVEKIRGFGEIVVGDIRDLARMKEVTAGMEAVLHLAASADASQTWETALSTNITGTYNTFAAAKAAGAKRIVFASSIHAVSGYPRDVQVKSNDPVNPGDIYGVSKCFGEALARYMAEQEGVSAICLRIGGWMREEWMTSERGLGFVDVFVSPRDLNQLIEKSIEADHLKFAIFNGLSENPLKRLDISDARELIGYRPQDDATRIVETLQGLGIAEKLLSHSLSDGRQKSGLRNDV